MKLKIEFCDNSTPLEFTFLKYKWYFKEGFVQIHKRDCKGDTYRYPWTVIKEVRESYDA